MFVIRPGKYVIPNFGKLDTSKKVSNTQCLALYENNKFPFISITEEALPFLKKQKLTEKRLAPLIVRAKTIEEVNLLLEVKTTKALEKIAETRISALNE